MALVSMKTLLQQAQRENRGCGAFSVGNMEMVMGAIRAAEEMNTPIILQIAEVRLKHSPLHLMGPMMIQAAREASVDVAVHLDHGLTLETVKEALQMGFTSVMLDASTLPFEENIEKTRQVVELAAAYGATVEAELGLVGGSEDGSCDHGIRCTDPNDAAVFVERTGIDALAVAIGNAHGNYPVAPTLAFDVLKQIQERVDIPLVLHGGSGIVQTLLIGVDGNEVDAPDTAGDHSVDGIAAAAAHADYADSDRCIRAVFKRKTHDVSSNYVNFCQSFGMNRAVCTSERSSVPAALLPSFSSTIRCR